MKQLVVGICDSNAARGAVEWTVSLGRATDAAVCVAHVYEPEFSASTASELYDLRLAQVRDWVQAVDGTGVDVETVVELGGLSETLARLADERHCDLLVLGLDAQHGSTAIGLGSVRHHLAHHYEGSIAAVPEGSMLAAPLRVIVGVDGSPGSGDALAWAGDLARVFDGSVSPVFAYDPMADSYPRPDASEYRGEAEVRAQLVELFGEADALDLKVLPGSPRDVLAEQAAATESSVVVVGARRHGLVGNLHRGLVPMELLHSCPRPVVIVQNEV